MNGFINKFKISVKRNKSLNGLERYRVLVAGKVPSFFRECRIWKHTRWVLYIIQFLPFESNVIREVINCYM